MAYDEFNALTAACEGILKQKNSGARISAGKDAFAIRFLYSASASSSRSFAVVSRGILCDAWIYSFTPRSTKISATVQTVIHTQVINAIVDTEPTLSR